MPPLQRGLDEVLDAHRNAHEDMPQVLGSVAVGELERYPTLHSLACRYIPQSESAGLACSLGHACCMRLLIALPPCAGTVCSRLRAGRGQG